MLQRAVAPRLGLPQVATREPLAVICVACREALEAHDARRRLPLGGVLNPVEVH